MEEINTEIKLFNVLKLKYRVEKSQKEVKILGKEFITKFKNRYKIGYKNKILKLSEYFTIKNDDKLQKYQGKYISINQKINFIMTIIYIIKKTQMN